MPYPTLAAVLAETGDHHEPYAGGPAVQVFTHDGTTRATGWRYHHLADYVVRAAVSGPSLVLMPKPPRPTETADTPAGPVRFRASATAAGRPDGYHYGDEPIDYIVSAAALRAKRNAWHEIPDVADGFADLSHPEWRAILAHASRNGRRSSLVVVAVDPDDPDSPPPVDGRPEALAHVGVIQPDYNGRPDVVHVSG